jgi:hypothetical protein
MLVGKHLPDIFTYEVKMKRVSARHTAALRRCACRQHLDQGWDCQSISACSATLISRRQGANQPPAAPPLPRSTVQRHSHRHPLVRQPHL